MPSACLLLVKSIHLYRKYNLYNILVKLEGLHFSCESATIFLTGSVYFQWTNLLLAVTQSSGKNWREKKKERKKKMWMVKDCLSQMWQTLVGWRMGRKHVVCLNDITGKCKMNESFLHLYILEQKERAVKNKLLFGRPSCVNTNTFPSSYFHSCVLSSVDSINA